MKNIKIVGAALTALVLLIVIVQNLAPVEMDLLFYSFDFPLAGLLFIALALGFALGLLVMLVTRKKSPPKVKTKPAPAAAKSKEAKEAPAAAQEVTRENP